MSSETVAHVYGAVGRVQQELAKVGIAKTSKNQQQGFKFRGIDAVLNALSGLLAQNNLFLRVEQVGQLVRETGNAKSGSLFFNSLVTLQMTAVSTVDGSETVIATCTGEGKDNGDKATSKAHSMAMKYCAFLGFCIPLEGVLDDSDLTTPEDTVPNSPSKAPSSPQEGSNETEATEAQAEAPKAKRGRPAGSKNKAKTDPADDQVTNALNSIEAAEDADSLAELKDQLAEVRRLGEDKFKIVKDAFKAKMAKLEEKE
jgi:hypothetical protein